MLLPVLVPAALIGGGYWWFINSGVKLPKNADKIVDEVLAEKALPEFIVGKTGVSQSSGVDIWYNTMQVKGKPKGTILLVMGHSTTALAWPDYFYKPLMDAGYQVIRYDNRGLGMSDWVKDWRKKNAYTLEDMAKDGIAVLDALGVEKAHIIGVSMGGMIAQRMAISHSERVLSLTSIMSSGYMNDPNIPPVPKQFIQNLTKLVLKYAVRPNDRKAAKFGMGVRLMLRGKGDGEINFKDAAQKSLFERKKRRGSNPKVRDQHTAAIELSGSRLQELQRLNLPTLVIHGKADPLVLFEHGEKSASRIPNAKTLWIETMGHDLAVHHTPTILKAIFENIEETEKV